MPDKAANAVELTILMPCLNEAETVGTCIGKAQRFLAQAAISGEVLIADNGSTDGSQAIAEKLGARVVTVADRGYGAALIGGIQAANGRYVVMGDADDSYDFSALAPFVDRLRDGADLVMGNRFKGGIAPGAMPFLHRYLGNPVLSWTGRLFFHLQSRRLPLRPARLQSRALECAQFADYGDGVRQRNGGSRRFGRFPHRGSSDRAEQGWPLAAAASAHLAGRLAALEFFTDLQPEMAVPLSRPVSAGPGYFYRLRAAAGAVKVGNVAFDIHTFTVACITVLVGTQALSFGAVARKFATVHKLLPPSRRFSGILAALTLNRILIGSALIALGGLAGVVICILQWASTGFGPLEYSALLRILILSLTAIAIGVQLALTGFLSAIVEIPIR